jgi:hypothetical protein
VLLAAFFCSCSGRIDGTIREDGDSAGAELRLAAALEPRMAALLRSLSMMVLDKQAAPDAPLLNGPAMARSLSGAPGISSAALENSGPTAVRGTVIIANLDEFLAVPGLSPDSLAGSSLLLKYDPAGTLRIRLDRETGPRILPLLSEDVNAYLSALLAPVATGEAVTRAEYLGLVATIYGRGVADEITAARIQVNLEAPRTITSIRGGTARGRQAQFSISLPDLLVLEQPLDYEISWK